MLEARSGDGAIKSFPRMGVKAKLAAPSESSTGLQNKTFHCEICDVHVNSETQLKQVSGGKMSRAVRRRKSPPPKKIGVLNTQNFCLVVPISTCAPQKDEWRGGEMINGWGKLQNFPLTVA